MSAADAARRQHGGVERWCIRWLPIDRQGCDIIRRMPGMTRCSIIHHEYHDDIK